MNANQAGTDGGPPGVPREGSAVAGLLRAMKSRLRLVWAWAVASLLAPLVAAAAVLLVMVGRFRPWAWPEPTALALTVGVVMVLLAAAILQPLSWLSAARAADKGLAARDIFTSVLQFKNLDDEFGRQIRYRAERMAQHDTASAQARQAVPLPGGRPILTRWAIAGVLAVVAVGLAVMSNPQDAERRRLEAVQAQTEELAEQVEELADELDEAADGADVDPLTAELAQLAEELRQVDSMEEAAELLDQQAAELNANRSPNFASEEAAAQGLERSLDARPLPGEPSGSPSEQLAAVADGLDELSRDEQEALAERLAELAEAQAAGDPATAAALDAAAQQLAAGDVAGAQASLGEAALAQGANASGVAAQQATNAASGQLSNLADQARTGQAQPGQGQGEGSGEGQGEGEGSGQGAGSGEGSGTGEGQGQGSGQGSGQGAGQGQGSGQGSGTGGQGGSGAQGTVGGAAGGSGQGQGGVGRPGGFDQPDAEGDNSGFTIVDPSALAEGDPLELGGSLTGEGQSETVGRGEGLTTTGQSRIPVSDVVGDYSQRASEALDRNRLSPSQQELVRNYFDQLTTGGN